MDNFLGQILANIVAKILYERVFPQMPLLFTQVRQLTTQLKWSPAAIIGYLLYTAFFNSFLVLYAESLTFWEVILVVPALSLMGVLMTQLNLAALRQ